MPHPCVVCGRSRMNPNNKKEEYTFFGFPVNDEPRCKRWLEFCCREELYKLTRKQLLQRMICSKHFMPSDFASDVYDRLNVTAVPSVYDPNQSLFNISCVLCGRFRKHPLGPENDDATFHHFPGEEFRCLDWLDFVGDDSYYRLTRKEIMYCYICSKHFHKKQFLYGYENRLADGVVPEIKYPDDHFLDEEYLDSPLPSPVIDIEPLFGTCEENVQEEISLPEDVLKGQACAACGRLRLDPMNKKDKCKFHPFPAYEIGRCLKWCQFLEREDISRMSPNQIRKLVLCSKHFQVGQNFNNDVDPCDAVPTIKDGDESSEIIIAFLAETELDEENRMSMVSVSSKKPKMDPDSTPKPLAKKRGKSKRPTIINIPKVETKDNDFVVQKVPIPSANNWKFMTNQFQPIALTSSILSSNVANVDKVILPFSGNISNLGTPIPVDSLSSIPPGLLFKIDLPEQTNDKPVKRRRKSPIQPMESTPVVFEDRARNITTLINENGESSIDHFLDYSEDCRQMTSSDDYETDEEEEDDGIEEYEDVEQDEEMEEDVRVIRVKRGKPKKIKKRSRKSKRNQVVSKKRKYKKKQVDGPRPKQVLRRSKRIREPVEYKDDYHEIEQAEEDSVDLQDNYIEIEPVEVVEEIKAKKVTRTCRRTLLPIERELRQFLMRIKPQVRRLPKKSQAQVKLAIINKVIERL